MACPPNSDNSFGPRIDHSCRRFDFTLQFEDVVFTCIPATLFLIFSLPDIFLLLTRSRPVFRRFDVLLAIKMTILTGLFGSQLAFLTLRVLHDSVSTGASLAGDTLSCIATVAGCFLSVASHRYTLRPSTPLTLYLSATFILDIPRVRTIWLLKLGMPESSAISAAFVFTVLASVLESFEASKVSLPRNNGATKTREMYSGLWARTFFTWLATTFRVGSKKVISLPDLPDLDIKLESSTSFRQLAKTWVTYDRKGRYALFRACLQSYLPSLLSIIIPRLCLTALTFSQPFLISTTVKYVAPGAHPPDSNFGRGLIGAWALVYLGMAVANSIYQYQNLRLVTRLRGGLTSLISQRTLQTRAADMEDITAVTLMGTDVGRITDGMSVFVEVWASLLDVATGCWLLERQLSLACLAPIILVLVFIMITSKVAALAGLAQRQWVEMVQERLRVTSTMLENIKSIKLLGITQSLFNIISRLRLDEIKASRSFRKILVSILLLSLSPINLAPVVTFVVYIIISIYKRNWTLLTAQAFTSIALITLVTTPVIVFIQMLPKVFQCVGTFDRIQEFYNYSEDSIDEIKETAHRVQKPDNTDTKLRDLTVQGNVLQESGYILRNASFAWNRASPITLKSVNINIKPNAITAIVGPAGSGKSALLNSLLGEMAANPRSTDGWACPQQRRMAVAYCAQQPWLENKTVLQNIIGPLPYDNQWYGVVKWACGLVTNVEYFDRGDETRVGSQGSALSGGQRHRIALARAVYSRANTILLDDVFSGLDANLVADVSTRLLGPEGLLQRQNTTIVLVTHNPAVLRLAHNVIVIEEGRITQQGQLQNLHGKEGHVSRFDLPLSTKTKSPDEQIPKITSEAVRDTNDCVAEVAPADDKRKRGDFSVYKYYLTSSGLSVVALHIVFMIVWIFCTEFSTVWVKWWSETNDKEPNKDVGFYISIYAMLGVAGTIGACLAAWSGIINIISNSASQMHSDLLRATLHAPIQFFTATDSGETLNRFSQDMELIDMDLPTTMINYSSTALSCLAKVIILAIFSKYLGIVVPFMGVLLYFLQRFYLKTSRQLRLIGIEAKAPLYACFTESAAGAVTIRAFAWESHYQAQTYRLIDESQRPEYMLSCVQFCLGFVLEVLTAILAVILVTVIVTLKDRFSAGNVGVSLVLVVGFSETLARLIKTWTKLESSVGAVARVKHFLDHTQSEGKRSAGLEPPPEWPFAGAIVIKQLTTAYEQGANDVLKNVTMAVEPGQHIAICGSSGSGKSSLILSLLQMIKVKRGDITIDGIDTSSVSHEHLRYVLNIVPQEPFLLSGSLRLNIDPHGTASDDKIIYAVKRVGLWSHCENSGGLEMAISPTAWSLGQKQLLCFARAMARSCKILILDEAMSSVDPETENIMQEIIDSDLRHCTVLSVMHRLQHLKSYERVALFDNGSLIEYDNPCTLLESPTNFARLYDNATL